MSDRTCTMPGCNSKHRARGLCSAHYNSTQYTPAERRPKHDVPCAACGTTVSRRVEDQTRYKPTCSPECRQLVQWGAPAVTSYDWANDAVKRAREAGADVVDRIDRIDVFNRDAWTCYLCDQRVELGDCFNPLSATVDHIVPLSKGGMHTLSNTATCCLMCNSIKQASLTVTTAASSR